MNNKIISSAEQFLLQQRGSPLTRFTASTFAEHGRRYDTVSRFVARASHARGVFNAAAHSLYAHREEILFQPVKQATLLLTAALLLKAALVVLAKPATVALHFLLSIPALAGLKVLVSLLSKAVLIIVVTYISTLGARQVALGVDAYKSPMAAEALHAQRRLISDGAAVTANAENIRASLRTAGSLSGFRDYQRYSQSR